MNKEHLEKIKRDFDKSDYDLVVLEMESVTLSHVMANSQANLDNTWSAILQLSKGDLNAIGRLVDAAKIDFRDVIYSAQLESEDQNTADKIL